LRYLLLTVLISLLVWQGANLSSIVVIFFILSAEAMVVLPRWAGYSWIAVWTIVTVIFISQGSGNLAVGLFNGLGAGGGYLFIGAAANAQRRAETANAESQRLLAELQAVNQQLHAQRAHAEELAAVQERNRLAREVHDTLGHRLTVAAVQLEGAQRLIERDPARAATMVATVHQQVVEGLNELRRTVGALRAPVEENLPLPSALKRLVQHFQEATGITTHLQFPAQLVSLPEEHRHTLYRAAQELLTNVQRHAQAQTVWIQLDGIDQSPPEIRLTICDDGLGLPTDQPQGFGLRGLQERATLLNGTLLLENRTEGGTQVRLTLPLPAATIATHGDKA